MNEIKIFLKHLERKRLRTDMPLHMGEIKVRSEEDKRAIEESAKMAEEDAIA